MPHRLLALLALLAIFSPGPRCSRAACTDYPSYFHWEGMTGFPGTASSPEVFGSYLVATATEGFLPSTAIDVVDISNPARPRHVLRTELAFDSTRTVDPNRVYLFGHDAATLWVVDVADPLDPAVVSVISAPRRVAHIAHGGWLYVSFWGGDRYWGLRVFDFANPREPEFRREMHTFVPLDRLVASGGLLVAREAAFSFSTDTGFSVFDLDDPSWPEPRARFLPGAAIDIDCRGSIVYVAQGQDGLLAVDIHDPDSPQVVASRPSPCWRTSVHGTKLLLQEGPSPGATLLTLADISVPSAPQPMATWPQPGVWRRAFVFGDQLVVPTTTRVASLDVRHTAATVAGALDVLPGGQARDIASNGHFAFTARPDLSIVDVSDPEDLRVVGRFHIAANGEGVCIDEGLVYFSLGTQGLMIADAEVADPADPARRSWTLLGPSLEGIDVEDGLAALTTAQSELLLVDVSTPENPFIRSSIQLPFAPGRIDLCHGVAFVLGAGGLQVVEVGNPDAPVLRGFTATGSAPHGLRAEVGRCWVAEDAGLSRIDVTDLDHPLADALWPLETPATAVELLGKWAFVGGSHPQINVVDTEQLGDRVITGSCYFGGLAVTRVTRSGDGVLVATESLYAGELAFVPPPCEPTALFASDLRAEAGDRSVLLSWDSSPGEELPGIVVRAADVTSEPRPIAATATRRGGRWTCTDTDVKPDTIYWYRVAQPKDVDLLSYPVAVRTGNWSALTLTLEAGKPNPFRERVELHFVVPSAGRTRLSVHDVTGRLVRVLRDGEVLPGRFSETWDGNDGRGRRVASGTYFVTLTSGGRGAHAKILRLH